MKRVITAEMVYDYPIRLAKQRAVSINFLSFNIALASVQNPLGFMSLDKEVWLGGILGLGLIVKIPITKGMVAMTASMNSSFGIPPSGSLEMMMGGTMKPTPQPSILTKEPIETVRRLSLEENHRSAMITGVKRITFWAIAAIYCPIKANTKSVPAKYLIQVPTRLQIMAPNNAEANFLLVSQDPSIDRQK